MKTTWLTGSGGFIGRHVLQALRGRGDRTVCLTNNPGNKSALACDYQDRAGLRSLLDAHGVPDAFIHLGWGAMEDPGADEHLTRNVADAKGLVDALFDAGVRTFVFAGSINEYGAREGLLVEDQPAVGRMTNYALGKAAVTAHGLEQAARRGRTFVSARVCYTYGAGQRAGSLINKLFNCQRDGIAPELGPCEHYRDYIHVTDVASGLARCCDVTETGVLNLGGGRCWQVREFVTLLWRELGGAPERLRIGAHAMRAGEPEQPRSFVSLERLRRLTGWQPELTLEEGIRLTVKMLREN